MLSEQLLLAMNHISNEKIETVSNIIYGESIYQRKKHSFKATKRLLAIAAVIGAFLAFAIVAYAIGLFSFSHRPRTEAETYSIKWENQSGEIVFDDFQYVFKFDGPSECNGVKFREGWLPFAPSEEVNAWAKDEEGWRTRLVSECAPEVDSTSNNYQPYRVELFYAPQFVDDGALFLNYQTPEEIIEEQWGEYKVMKIHAIQHQPGVDDDELDIHIPDRDMNYYFVILFHPYQGYIAIVSGTSDMVTVEHVAKELQFKQTDEIIRKEDFTNNCTFIDVGQG